LITLCKPGFHAELPALNWSEKCTLIPVEEHDGIFVKKVFTATEIYPSYACGFPV